MYEGLVSEARFTTPVFRTARDDGWCDVDRTFHVFTTSGLLSCAGVGSWTGVIVQSGRT